MTTPGATEAVTPEQRQRLEYTCHLQSTSEWPHEKLNKLGGLGWELVQVVYGAAWYQYIFKRPIRSLLPKEEGQAPDAPR